VSRLVNLYRGRGRRPAVAALAAIGAAALALAVVVIVNSPGSSRGASQPKVAGAATVQRRDLVETDTESGTLGYANTQTVYDRLSGTITWLPAAGQPISPGQALFKVDNRPVILFDGGTPAYRDLSPSDSDGPDILELNRNLIALGFADGQITPNTTWQAGTTDAVERWQGSVGETETGTITLGQVVFLPGKRLVGSVQTVLGSNGQSSSGAGSGSNGSGNTGNTTGPHLHFQISDRPSTLDTTSLPFVFESMTLESRTPLNLDDIESYSIKGTAIPVDSKFAKKLTRAMPLSRDVIDFHRIDQAQNGINIVRECRLPHARRP